MCFTLYSFGAKVLWPKLHLILFGRYLYFYLGSKLLGSFCVWSNADILPTIYQKAIILILTVGSLVPHMAAINSKAQDTCVHAQKVEQAVKMMDIFTFFYLIESFVF